MWAGHQQPIQMNRTGSQSHLACSCTWENQEQCIDTSHGQVPVLELVEWGHWLHENEKTIVQGIYCETLDNGHLISAVTYYNMVSILGPRCPPNIRNTLFYHYSILRGWIKRASCSVPTVQHTFPVIQHTFSSHMTYTPHFWSHLASGTMTIQQIFWVGLHRQGSHTQGLFTQFTGKVREALYW